MQGYHLRRPHLNFPPSSPRTGQPPTQRCPAVHVPLPVSTLSSWEPLFFPVQPNVRVHCSINLSPVDTSEECQFTLNLEHCGDVIPLMKGVLTTSKLLPFSYHCHIKPASGLMFCAKSELWAAPPLPRPPHAITPSLPRRVMNRLQRVIRSGQLHDARSPMGGSPVASPSWTLEGASTVTL